MSLTKREEIKELTTREQCRLKLPIWYGSRDNFTHGVNEVLANSSDVVVNNYEKGDIILTLNEDLQTISIKDTGTGVPIGETINGVPSYVKLFETLFAGTNYENLEKGKTTTGSNGCGTAVLMNTSTIFDVESRYDGNKFIVQYRDGVMVNFEKQKLPQDDEFQHGSIFTFKLDKEMYTSITYNPEDLKQRLNRLASTSNKLTCYFNHLEGKQSYHYNTISDYLEVVKENALCKTVSFPPKQYTTKLEEASTEVEVKDKPTCLEEIDTFELAFSLSTQPVQETYLNGTYLKEGGTIKEGVLEGFRRFFNKQTKKLNITIQDVEMSFNIYGKMLSTNAEFQNQTKFSTAKKLYKDMVIKYMLENLEILNIEQPKITQQILKHLEEINKFNVQNEKKIKDIKKKLIDKVDGINNKIKGLTDCRKYGEDSELFIAEGLSALGSLVASRDATYQACFPIRGKILSTLKASYGKIFENELVMSIINCLGCGIEVRPKGFKNLPPFDITKLRYGKFIIATDADADGADIACLLLTMIYRLIPSLIYQGRVYRVITPLYEITFENEEIGYAFSESEFVEIMKSHNPKKCKIQRMKGLGEADPEQMHYFAMNPETRHIQQITVEDVERMCAQFDKWMATEVDGRREHIMQNLYQYTENLD